MDSQALMGKDRVTRAVGSHFITQYTTQKQPIQWLTRRIGGVDVEPPEGEMREPTRADLLQAIQGLRSALARQIETFSINVNLLQADLGKISDKFPQQRPT
ncbi:hypothetical protein NDU88_005672 [Pleurodeles waltl]|uniref:Uncharacterized protein n=1 Tax=Pleurodeles waltl TaxID=8319 RepID=A0AAV7MA15_PLEWA|nr:hypothetical protein NDU88_005672 [Pleurodeles waltl]